MEEVFIYVVYGWSWLTSSIDSTSAWIEANPVKTVLFGMFWFSGSLHNQLWRIHRDTASHANALSAKIERLDRELAKLRNYE